MTSKSKCNRCNGSGWVPSHNPTQLPRTVTCPRCLGGNVKRSATWRRVVFDCDSEPEERSCPQCMIPYAEMLEETAVIPCWNCRARTGSADHTVELSEWTNSPTVAGSYGHLFESQRWAEREKMLRVEGAKEQFIRDLNDPSVNAWDLFDQRMEWINGKPLTSSEHFGVWMDYYKDKA